MIQETTAWWTVLNLSQKPEWQEWVEKCEVWDVFFLPDYLAMYEQRGEGKARLFVYQESKDTFVLYPYLLRDIPNALNGESYFDIVTAYGYGGPLYSKRGLEQNGKFVKNFRQQFDRYCQLENIVSEFARFHPYLHNERSLNNKMFIADVGDIVYNDLWMNEDDIWDHTASSKKRRIKKSRKNEVTAVFIEGDQISEKDIHTFYEIYTETMDKKNASSFYYFSLDFFKQYFKELKEQITLAFALHENKAISANLILKSQEFATIHLSASLKEFLPLCPNCNLRYESILWAKKQGFSILDHGGGKMRDDSLFKYKQQFSKDTGTYYIGKKVHLPDVYEALTLPKMPVIEKENADFFPEYRMNM